MIEFVAAHLLIFSIAVVTIFVLDVLALVDIFRTPGDDAAKLLWLLIVIGFPLLGMLAWFIGGKSTLNRT